MPQVLYRALRGLLALQRCGVALFRALEPRWCRGHAGLHPADVAAFSVVFTALEVRVLTLGLTTYNRQGRRLAFAVSVVFTAPQVHPDPHMPCTSCSYGFESWWHWASPSSVRKASQRVMANAREECTCNQPSNSPTAATSVPDRRAPRLRHRSARRRTAPRPSPSRRPWCCTGHWPRCPRSACCCCSSGPYRGRRPPAKTNPTSRRDRHRHHSSSAPLLLLPCRWPTCSWWCVLWRSSRWGSWPW